MEGPVLYLARDMLLRSQLTWLYGFIEEACPEALPKVMQALDAELAMRERLYDQLARNAKGRAKTGDMLRIDGVLHMVVEVEWPHITETQPLGQVLARSLMVSDEPDPLRLDAVLMNAGWIPPLTDEWPDDELPSLDQSIQVGLEGTVDDNLMGQAAEVLAREVVRRRKLDHNDGFPWTY